MSIASLRLIHQHLGDKQFKTTAEAVAYFGAMQSQDFSAALWSIGRRVKESLQTDIQKAYDEGNILRTHIMRPTWHFVVPQQLRWMQQLTSHRVKTLMGHYNRKLELTPAVFAKSNAEIAKALQQRQYSTRQELKRKLETVGITTDVQRLAHLLIWAELESIVTSGPMRGKQFTYALVDERVPKTKEISREEVLSRLVLQYFQSHGPAQVKDFAWWSGLTVQEAMRGIEEVGEKLAQTTIQGKTYYFSNDSQPTEQYIRKILLLSVYDEYFIGYTDRGDIIMEDDRKQLPVGNALLTSLLIIDGKVAGTWKRKIIKQTVEFTVTLFKTISKRVREEIEEEAETYARFFGYESTSLQFMLASTK